MQQVTCSTIWDQVNDAICWILPCSENLCDYLLKVIWINLNQRSLLAHFFFLILICFPTYNSIYSIFFSNHSLYSMYSFLGKNMTSKQIPAGLPEIYWAIQSKQPAVHLLHHQKIDEQVQPVVWRTFPVCDTRPLKDLAPPLKAAHRKSPPASLNTLWEKLIHYSLSKHLIDSDNKVKTSVLSFLFGIINLFTVLLVLQLVIPSYSSVWTFPGQQLKCL